MLLLRGRPLKACDDQVEALMGCTMPARSQAGVQFHRSNGVPVKKDTGAHEHEVLSNHLIVKAINRRNPAQNDVRSTQHTHVLYRAGLKGDE